MAKNEFDITSLTPEQRDARLALDVERLLRFGRKHKLIKDLDILVARNTLLDLLAAGDVSHAFDLIGIGLLGDANDIHAKLKVLDLDLLKSGL